MTDSKVIVGTGRMGDFVHQGQVMGATQGFKNVSKIWLDKTISISDGIDKINADAANRHDVNVSAKNFKVVLDGDKPKLEIDGGKYTPTEHAWKQMCLWFGVPQTFYNVMNTDIGGGKKIQKRDSRDQAILVDVFQNGHRRIDQDKEFMFRVDKSGSCRAMLTDRYAAIDNVWYLEVLADLFKEIGGDEPRLSHWKGDSDTIFGNVLIPDTCRSESDSDYGGMVSIGNCEIGKRRITQRPSVFRAICMNGCIWDQKWGANINKVHRGEIELVELRKTIVLNIHEQIPLMGEAVTRFLSTKDKVIGKVPLKNIFALLSQECKFAKEVCQEVVSQYSTYEQDNKNLFGVLNGITRAGQKFSPETWVEMDTLAGDMMGYSTNQWGAFLNRAENMDKKAIEKALYMSV